MLASLSLPDLPTAAAKVAPAAALEAILSHPERQLDYARAKLAIDRFVDPALDTEGAAAALDRLTSEALRLAGPAAGPDARLAALRRLIYESGPWNGGRPFAYDHEDPLGQNPRSRLLPVYLTTRLGNCVSMPILFLILGDRLGLDMALASAPLHMFVRWRDSSGRTLNLETTSGAHPARDAWFRHNPRDVHAMLNKATACAHLIRTEFEAHYPHPFLIPMPQRLRYLELARLNRELFATAEGLGWRPEDQGRDDSTERSRSCS